MVTMALPISLVPYPRVPVDGNDPPKLRPRLCQPDAVRRAQAGDEDAFSELYVQNKKRVYSICMRLVRDPSLAEDLSQEAFLQLHRKLGSFRGESAFTTWLHRLTVNVVLMYLRSACCPFVRWIN
jgi:hypothetical protein